jgi:hypothetical protein
MHVPDVRLHLDVSNGTAGGHPGGKVVKPIRDLRGFDVNIDCCSKSGPKHDREPVLPTGRTTQAETPEPGLVRPAW